MRWGNEWPGRRDLSSLRLLGSVGEPINPEAWMWYHEVIGGGRCPVVDTWWQTETGAIMITPLPGLTTLKPGSATREGGSTERLGRGDSRNVAEPLTEDLEVVRGIQHRVAHDAELQDSHVDAEERALREERPLERVGPGLECSRRL
jgi:acyl-coenzyme A synthetase/AMP-(fatty) acid ligase